MDADKKSAEEYFNDGISLYEQNKYEEAIIAFTKVIELDPNYKDVYYWRGYSYCKLSQGEKVADYTKSIQIDLTKPKVNNRAVQTEDCPKLIEPDPTDTIANNNRGLSWQFLDPKKTPEQGIKTKTKSGGFIKSNIAYLVWVIVYILLVWVILGMTQEALIFTVVAYAVSIVIALSPVGEWLLCILQDTRKIVTSQDKNYLEPIFNEVYEQVKERTPSISDNVSLRIVNAMYINAFAMGKHTIAITRGAMATMTEDELKGVIAHEFGHIVNGDTKALLIKVVGNMIFSLMVFCLKLVLSGFRLLLGIFTQNQAIDFFIGGLRLMLDIAVIVFMFAGDIILSINSRVGEYLADEYASMAGYNGELTQALYLLQKMDMGGDIKLTDKIRSSHPNLEKRIARLENWQDG